MSVRKRIMARATAGARAKKAATTQVRGPLRPFFSYYGSKWSVIPMYPSPRGTIIEPFAGSASYATRYHWHPVILVEKNPVIAALWRWLISATPADIYAIPVDVDRIDELDVRDEARSLVGFWFNNASCAPRNVRSKWGRNGRLSGTWSIEMRGRVARQVALISHWQVIEGEYEAAPEIDATWFIDPPYQGYAGSHYVHGSDEIDYAALGRWCRSRGGRTIVCENHGADWLPFRPLAELRGQRRDSIEAIWTNDSERFVETEMMDEQGGY